MSGQEWSRDYQGRQRAFAIELAIQSLERGASIGTIIQRAESILRYIAVGQR